MISVHGGHEATDTLVGRWGGKKSGNEGFFHCFPKFKSECGNAVYGLVIASPFSIPFWSIRMVIASLEGNSKCKKLLDGLLQ